MRRNACLFAVAGVLVSATGAAAESRARVQASEVVGPTPGAVVIRGAADALGRQIVVASGEIEGTVTLAMRDVTGGWQLRPLSGLDPAMGVSGPPVPVAAAGDGVAAIALTQNTFVEGVDSTVRVLIRDRADGELQDAGSLSVGIGHAASVPAIGVGADGRAVVAFRTQPRGARLSSVAIAVREPGGAFGPARVVSAPGAEPPVIAMSPLGRAVVAWSRHARVEAVTVDRGTVGRPVPFSSASASAGTPFVAVGAHGEAVVAWWELSRRRGGGQQRVVAVTRSRTGAFRSRVVLGRPPIMHGDRPAATIDGRGNAVVAWGTTVVTRGGALRRGPSSSRIDVRFAATRTGRFGRLVHAERAAAIAPPSAAPTCDGALLTWTVRRPANKRRLVRTARARNGVLGPATTAGAMLGSGSQSVLTLPRGHCGATLLWHDSGLGFGARLMAADTLP